MLANGVLAGAPAPSDRSRKRGWISALWHLEQTQTARNLISRYGRALVFVALALGASVLLWRVLPYPFFLLFFAAVMVSAWFGGTGPGILSAVLSTLAIDYFFIPPLRSWGIHAAGVGYSVAFLACALAGSFVVAAKRRDVDSLRAARDRLELQVAKRTLELANSVSEREKAQQALIQAQSDLAHLSQVLTMGELTASIAHEVNQPLTAVVNYGNACLGWLSADPPNLEEARLAAETIVKDGTRAAAVLGRIRALFQKRPLSTEWLDVNAVVQELIPLLSHEIAKQHVSLRTELSPTLPRAKADRVQLQQVLLNLIANAIDAMRSVTGRAREIVVRSRREGSSSIRLSVEDNGCGFGADVAEKIFEPFFSTKPHGTGMGLAISRSIVESHQGRLWAERAPGGGAAFQIILPVEPQP
jgi:C4-dicarboxylate-specific signal transduction histidine kinase